jgi:hypothetical protein
VQNQNLEFVMDGMDRGGMGGAGGYFAGLDGINLFGPPPITDCAYQNAATCPDCGGGMIRLGVCFSCPGCGFESCSV